MQHSGSENSFNLVVVEGLKAGARACLSQGSVFSVGSGFDCDIVLGNGDPAKQQQRIEITSADGQFSVQIIEGELSIGGVSSKTNTPFYVAPNTPISLGDSVFEIQLPATEQTSNPVPATAVAHGKPKKSRFTALAAVAMLGLCLVVAGVLPYLPSATSEPQAGPPPPTLEQLLAGEGYNNLVVEAVAENTHRISGRVNTRAEHIALQALIGAFPAQVESTVSIDEVFIEDVAAIYRLNGVDASVVLSAAGEVDVQTAIADVDLLEQVEASAYQDVPGLLAINRHNTPPAADSEGDNPDFTVLPGKKIKMVVTTEPAFILTEDGSRYFTGAILPSGYTIKSIFEKTVKLERDNKIVDLVF